MKKADENRDEINATATENERVDTGNVKRRKSSKAGNNKGVKKIVLIVLAILLVAALAGLAIWKYNQSHPKEKENPAVVELKKRLPDLKKSVDEKPNDASARYNLGSAYYGTNDKEAAATQYQEAIRIDPKNPAYYNNLGNTYRDLKQYDKAIEQYNKSIELQPKNVNAYSNLAFVQSNFKNDINSAVATYDKAANAMEGSEKTNMLNMKGMTQERANKKDEARATYNQVLQLDPNNAVAKANLDKLK